MSNEAVLKALFNVNDDQLTFAKAIEVAQEVEDAARVAKETAQASSQGEAAYPEKSSEQQEQRQ